MVSSQPGLAKAMVNITAASEHVGAVGRGHRGPVQRRQRQRVDHDDAAEEVRDYF